MQDFSRYITPTMAGYYHERTARHINLVKQNGYNVIKHLPMNMKMKNELAANLQKHDMSKFEDPEKTPYILITWRYHVLEDEFRRLNLTKEILADMSDITEYHVKNNKHHPDYWDDTITSNFLNPKDRDAPGEKVINATKMPLVSIIEMVCDWFAVGQERGNTAREWAGRSIGIRWAFTEPQKIFIYNIIDILENI